MFSLLDGFATVEEYAEYSKSVNQKYLCITDHGMMGVIPRQIRACDEHNLNPIFGIELYVNNLQPSIKTNEEYKKYVSGCTDEDRTRLRKSYHLLAIAASDVGYSNLVKLSSWGWANGYGGVPRQPRLTHEQLMQHKEGIIFSSCCYLSEIGQAFDREGEEAAEQMLLKYMAMFKGQFLLEIMLLDFKKQKPYDAFIVKMYDKYHLPIICSQDCLVKDTVITTKDGLKYASDITINDYVLTHKNRFKKIEYVSKRKLGKEEVVYKIKSSLGTYIWEITENHPVLVANVKNKKWNVQRKEIKSFDWKTPKDLTTSDYLVFPKIKKEDVFADEDCLRLDLNDYLYDLDLSDTNHIKGLNYSAKLTLKDGNYISYHRFNKNNKIQVPRDLPMTDDLLKIIGLYIAEGSVETKGTLVGFGLHKNEQEELELIQRYFGQFNIKINIRHTGNGLSAKFSSVLFRQFFEKLCGKGSLNKNIPLIDGKRFKTLSERQFLIIFHQYWKGDGHDPLRHDRPGNVASVSKLLIYNLSIYLNALNIFVLPCVETFQGRKHKNPNANSDNWNDCHYLSFGSDTMVRFKNLFGYNLKLLSQTNRGKRYIESDDYYAVRVKSVLKSNYNDYVYNFQVEEDESYTANLAIVHNCHYCKKEDSKYQRLMLMTRTKNTVQDIERAMAEGNAEERFFELQDENLWMKSEDELNQKWLSDYTDIIPYDVFCTAKTTTVKVCESAKGVTINRDLKLPKLDNADERLKEEMIQGIKWRNLYSNEHYMKQLQAEYELICRKDFASYFLITKMFADEARRFCPQVLGWGTGEEAIAPGRGSAPGFLTCYVLGITDVDPIKHHLLPERFLSDARGGRQLKLDFSKLPIQRKK